MRLFVDEHLIIDLAIFSSCPKLILRSKLGACFESHTAVSVTETLDLV